MDARIVLALAYDGVLIATCAYALLRGGWPERIGAGINLVASVLSTMLRLLSVAAYAPAEMIVFSIDLAVVAGFYWLATTTSRFWPVWAFGFALADILVSIAGALLPRPELFAYYSGLGIYAYLALAALTLGTYRLPRNATSEQRRGRREPWRSPSRT